MSVKKNSPAKTVTSKTTPTSGTKGAGPKETPIKPATQKKPTVAKLKGKKLEDRIAPGMLGGGLVDPGMAEAVDSSSADVQRDQFAGDISETNSDYSGGNHEAPSSYLDESSSHHESDTSNEEYKDDKHDSANFNDNSQYDEFSEGKDSHQFVEDKPAWSEPDWVTAQADGSAVIAPPDGMSLDSNMASFPVEAANEALTLPHEASINTDGSVSVPLPEGTEFLEGANALIIPEGAVALNDIPPEMNAFENNDGSITLPLPEHGMEYNPENNQLNIMNDVANEMLPANVEIADNGQVNIQLPEAGVEVQDNGQIHLSPGAVDFMDHPPSEYIQDCEFGVANPDGSMVFTPPEDVVVEGGVMDVPFDSLDQMPIPEDLTINDDGTANIALPEGAVYNDDIHGMIMPADHFNPNDVPEGISTWGNPDGSFTVILPQGMEYDAASNSVHVDNYWLNEIAPDNVQINDDGSMNVALPAETAFYNDGSFSIPAEQLDFIDREVPAFIGDLQFAHELPDGSYNITPPEGVIVDPVNHVVTAPYEVAMEHLVPEGTGPVEDFTFNKDGTVTIGVPEGAQWNADTQILTLPADSVPYHQIPEEMGPVANPDGTISVSLQDGMDFNANTGELHIDNYWVNEMSPEHVEISPTGEFTTTLPQDTQFNPNGSFTIPEHATDFTINPAPAVAFYGPDWALVNPDHSITFETPAAVEVSAEDHTATMNVDYMQTQFENYIPEGIEFHADGTMTAEVPQGTLYNEDTGVITFPVATDIHLNEIPEALNPIVNPDGSVSFSVAEGMEYDSAEKTISFDNYWANELTPPSIEFNPNGEVIVHLPPDTHYFESGSVMIPEVSTDFIENSIPEYVSAGPDWVEANPDGSITFTPPENVVINDGVMEVPFTAINDFPIPEAVTINPDGSMNIGLPEGSFFNPDSNSFTIPQGEFHYHDLPESVDAHFNPDGTMTVILPEGMEYNPNNSSIELNNYWANEVAPDNIQIAENGALNITLPEGTQYHEGGEFTVPAEHADFIATDAPAFVTDVDFGSINPDGSYTFEPPQGMNVSAENFELKVPYNVAIEHLIPEGDGPITQNLNFNPDGTVSIEAPQGTIFNAQEGSLTFPAESVPVSEIPLEMSPVVHPDGTISVSLQDGMEYNPANGQMTFDNHWTNEMTPDCVEFHPDGGVTVALPPDTQFHGDGTFTIPENSLDFIQNPAPDYVVAGPDWINATPDGGVMIETPAQVAVNPAEGTASMNVDYMNQHFAEHIPNGVEFNQDGTMNVDVPQGTLFDANNNAVTFPEGTVHMHEIPPGMDANLNDNGSITLTLPDGATFDPAQGQVHLDNYWTNEVTPAHMEVAPTGEVTVHMPPDTHFNPDNSMTIPQHQADFMHNPVPVFDQHGPDWMSSNPDGSVTVAAPPAAIIDPLFHTMTMPVNVAMEHFGGNLIPEHVSINTNGTADIRLPEGAEFRPGENALHFPEGTIHAHECPPGTNPTVHQDGSISVKLPPGVNFNPADGGSIHVSNAVFNQMTPAPMEVTPQGQFVVHLPTDTQHFPGNNFVLSPNSAGLMNQSIVDPAFKPTGIVDPAFKAN